MRVYLGDNSEEVRNIDLCCDDFRLELAASYHGDESNDVEIYFDDKKDVVEFAKFVTYFAQKVERDDTNI